MSKFVGIITIMKAIKNYKIEEEESGRNVIHDSMPGILVDPFFELLSKTSFNANRIASFFHTSLKTFQRHFKEGRHLDPIASEHLIRITDLYKTGEEIFGNVAQFEKWLETPSPVFNQNAPIIYMVNPGGVQLLRAELTRIMLGYPL